MGRKKMFTVLLAVIAAASLGFNGYAILAIHDFQETDKSRTEEVKQEQGPNVRQWVIAANQLALQANTESGVQSEAVFQLVDEMNGSPGVEKKLAFVKGVSKEGPDIYLELDEVEWYEGEAAEKAAKEDGVPEEGTLASGFYLRNASNELERERLEADAIIAELSGSRPQIVNYADLKGEELKERLFYFIYVDGEMAWMEEKYRP